MSDRANAFVVRWLGMGRVGARWVESGSVIYIAKKSFVEDALDLLDEFVDGVGVLDCGG